jgi:hypothetical protein
MTNVQSIVDGYIAIWNETDQARRQQLISQIWTEDASYSDPMAQVEGHSGIDALVMGVHQQFPQSEFRRSSEIDAHHNCIRFSWELAPRGGEAFAGGIDVGLIRDGKLQSITGFLDFVPPAPAE